jgi:hypothetical protein
MVKISGIWYTQRSDRLNIGTIKCTKRLSHGNVSRDEPKGVGGGLPDCTVPKHPKTEI